MRPTRCSWQESLDSSLSQSQRMSANIEGTPELQPVAEGYPRWDVVNGNRQVRASGRFPFTALSADSVESRSA